MKNKIINPVLLLATLTLFNSACKKPSANTENNPFDETKAIENAKKQIASQGITQIMMLHQKSEGYSYTDGKGTEHTRTIGNTGNLARTTACNNNDDCTTFMAGTGTGVLEDIQNELVSVSRTSVCFSAGGSNTSNLDVVWKVSAPYTLLLQLSTTQKSRGIVRFYNSSNPNTPYLQYLNIQPVSIVNLGSNPVCPSLTDFEFKYTLTGVPNSNFESGNFFKCSYLAYTDCPVQVITSPLAVTALYNFSGNFLTQPCLRTDKVFTTPGTGPGGCMSALGIGNAVCSFPFGYVLPNQHVLEYKQANSSNWTSISLGAYDVVWLTPLVSGSGQWNIRYKNKVTGANACEGSWYTETWNL